MGAHPRLYKMMIDQPWFVLYSAGREEEGGWGRGRRRGKREMRRGGGHGGRGEEEDEKDGPGDEETDAGEWKLSGLQR